MLWELGDSLEDIVGMFQGKCHNSQDMLIPDMVYILAVEEEHRKELQLVGAMLDSFWFSGLT